jgi:hypothetical protein
MPKKLDKAKIERMAEFLSTDQDKILASFDGDGIRTIREAEKAYNENPKGSKLWRLARRKWNKFCRRRIVQASSIAEIKEAFEEVLHGSRCEALALNKWISFCSTLVEFEGVYHWIPQEYKSKKSVFRKWDKLAMQKARRASTFDELLNINGHSPVGGRAEELVSKKLAKFCSDIQGAKAVYECTLVGSKAQKLAQETWDALVLKMVKRTSTIKRLRMAYEKAREGSKPQKLALEKIYKLI